MKLGHVNYHFVSDFTMQSASVFHVERVFVVIGESLAFFNPLLPTLDFSTLSPNVYHDSSPLLGSGPFVRSVVRNAFQLTIRFPGRVI